MNEWRDFVAKYMPGADTADGNYVFAYTVSKAMLQVLKQCEGNFTRENIMKQAANLHDRELPTVLPGIKVNTSPTNCHPIRGSDSQGTWLSPISASVSVIRGEHH